jgi:DNA mismatch repair ATPase MutS
MSRKSPITLLGSPTWPGQMVQSWAAHLDVFVARADRARADGWCRPRLPDGDDLDIRSGCHPVVEARLEPGAFIPNEW